MRVVEHGARPEPAGIDAVRAPVVSIARIVRMLSFSLSFIAAAGGVWYAGERAADLARIEPVELGFGLIDTANLFLRQVRKDPLPHHVVLVGDSTLMAAKGMRRPRVQTLTGRVRLALEKYGEHGERLRLKTFCMPGLGPTGMYYATQTIIDAKPERVVLSLNLRGFNDLAVRTFSYAEGAGWLGAKQLPHALTLPLFASGLTADRLLFYNALVASGATPVWRDVRQLQARAFKLHAPVSRWADAQIGGSGYATMISDVGYARLARHLVDVDGLPRNTRPTVEQILGPVLDGLSPDHPNLRLLAAVLARFRAAEIPVLVYLEPFNVQYVRSLGISLERLPRSVRTIRRVVEGVGAELADLHAALPERAFRDDGDHYTFEGEPNGMYLLARRLAEHLVGKDQPTEQAMKRRDAVQ
jgi:hypothetical protein